MSGVVSVTDSLVRQSRRDERFAARYKLWQLSSLKRVRACGRFSAREDGVTVRVSGSSADGTRVAGLSGVQSCGSVWACPVCSAKIQAERQLEVATALARARMLGWEVLFVTFTMRHMRDHRLKLLWDRLSVGWRSVTSGSKREWAADRARFGIAGYLRLLEVTHGANGWHVHVHALIFCDPYMRGQAAARVSGGADLLGQELDLGQRVGPLSALELAAVPVLTDEAVNELGTGLFLRWRRGLVGSSGEYRGVTPSLRRGVDIRRVRSDDVIAEYFAKNVYSRKGEDSTAHDVTGAHSKETKNGNRTPFGLLAGLVDVRTGEVGPDFERDLELWQTFETVSRGKRQLLWSNGLRALLELGAVKEDQEIVDEGHDGDELAVIPPKVFRAIASTYQLGDLLACAELDDTGAALQMFVRGFEWYLEPPG